MKRVSTLLLLLCIMAVLCGTSEAAKEKFIRVYRDSSFDMYANTASLIQNRGIISVWIKTVYSDQGKAAVRKEMPSKFKKSSIDYGMDYFVFDTKKGKYNIKLASVYAKEKEIFRQGSKKWLPVKDGTIAAALINKVNNILTENNN